MKRLSIALLAAVLVMGMITACGESKSTWTKLRTERGPWEKVGAEVDCPNGVMLVSIEQAVGKEQTVTVHAQLGGSVNAKLADGILSAEAEVAKLEAEYKYRKVEVTAAGVTRSMPITPGQSIQYYVATQCDVFCRNENEEDLLYQPIEGATVSYAWVVTDKDGKTAEDTREKEENASNDNITYQGYSQFPQVPDFYDVLDGRYAVKYRYYDPAEDRMPLTWHYHVDSKETAVLCIEKYESAIKDSFSLIDEINEKRYFLSLDRNIALTIWTNTTSNENVFINISITEVVWE